MRFITSSELHKNQNYNQRMHSLILEQRQTLLLATHSKLNEQGKDNQTLGENRAIKKQKNHSIRSISSRHADQTEQKHLKPTLRIGAVCLSQGVGDSFTHLCCVCFPLTMKKCWGSSFSSLSMFYFLLPCQYLLHI